MQNKEYITFYFQISNSLMYGGRGSVHYWDISVPKCKYATLEKQRELLYKVAKDHRVPRDYVKFVTKEEYDRKIKEQSNVDYLFA